MQFIRGALLLGYLGVAVLACLDVAVIPRAFWTGVMPLVPLAVVLLGFHRWRRICPIAGAGAMGASLFTLARTRRVPRWLERARFSLPFVLLSASLLLRLLATNGDPAALGVFLLALLGAAFAANALWGGRSFCHYLCPVGVVEHIYTDAGGLAPQRSGRCRTCTGCKPACSDIDQDRSYRLNLADPRGRTAVYAFPGLVLGFYAYFWLRGGTWEAFFDGRWTVHPVSAELVLGPGLFFWTGLPALVAAPAALAVASLGSWLLFAGIERMLRGPRTGEALARHRAVSLAAFTAFNLFYCFAGAPLHREVPGLPRLVAFAVPVVATLVLLRRWQFDVHGERARRALPVVS